MGVTLTPSLTPNLGSVLLLKKSSFYSQSAVKITRKFLLLTWVVFLGTGYLLFCGYFNSSISWVTFTPEEQLFKLLFGVKVTPQKITPL